MVKVFNIYPHFHAVSSNSILTEYLWIYGKMEHNICYFFVSNSILFYICFSTGVGSSIKLISFSRFVLAFYYNSFRHVGCNP